MNRYEENPKRGKGDLPLNDEDLELAYGGSHLDEEHDEYYAYQGISFIRLALAIILSAPVATFLALVVMDIYPDLATSMGLRKPEPVITQADPVAVAKVAEKDESLAKWIGAFERSNRELVAAINKQSKVLADIANRKPDVIRVESKTSQKSAPPQIKVASPKVIVVKVPTRERFDLEYEKQKVLELSGVDLDDPVASSKPFDRIKSRDTLKELKRSLDLIISNARDHDEISDFMKNNALTAKRYVIKRLRKAR